jgi:hypothetical protein
MASLKDFLKPQPREGIELFGKDIIGRLEKEKRVLSQKG